MEDVQEDEQQPPAAQTKQSEKALKKLYKCKIKGCQHAPFMNKHSLATNLMVVHKKEGSKWQIYGKVMSKHHISGHLDKHTLSKRFQCRERLSRNVVCDKNYKQKSASIRHLKEKHSGKCIEAANVVIRSEEQVRYETAGDYELEEEDEEQRAEQINALVEDFREVVYQ